MIKLLALFFSVALLAGCATNPPTDTKTEEVVVPADKKVTITIVIE